MNVIARRIVNDMRALRPFNPYEDEVRDLRHAYEIQDEVTKSLMDDQPSRRIAGYKIAFNRNSSMRYYGLSEPCYASLFSDQIHRSGVALPLSGFVDPVIEAEIAVRLKSPLDGDEDVRALAAAVDALCPAIEIMDVRGAFARDPSAAAAVAQRIYSKGAVVGPPFANGIVPGKGAARLFVDAVPIESVAAIDPQEPLEAVRWLASRLRRDGRSLEAGMVILTGAHLPGHPVRNPCTIKVQFAPSGEVSADFAA